MYYLNVISEKGKYNQTPASRKLVGLVPKRKSKKNAVFINQNYHLVDTTYIICNSVTNTPHVNNSHNFFFFLFFFFQKHTQNPIIYGAIYHFHSRHNTKKLHINFVHILLLCQRAEKYE